jgi:hypothetical protein
MSDLFSDTFGNYMLHGIDEIHVPEPVSWWPQTIGWKVLALVLALWLLYRLYLLASRWWKNRYRRVALARLDALQSRANGQYQQVLASLPELLKATALQAYPRTEIASLSGREWLAFLDAHYDGPEFSGKPGRQLLAVAYQDQSNWQLSAEDANRLIAMVRRWLRQHREHSASRGRSHA